jgi:hypothetical protein
MAVMFPGRLKWTKSQNGDGLMVQACRSAYNLEQGLLRK